MKNKLFITIMIYFITVPLMATAQELDQPEAMAQVLPRWKASLSEIQQAASALLESNSNLTAEYNQLKQELAQLQSKIDAQRAQNVQLTQDIVQAQAKSRQVIDPAELTRLKGLVAQRELEIKVQQDALSAARLRRSSMESRVAVMRAQVAGLEIARKGADANSQGRDAARIEAVKAETVRVKDRTASTVKQVHLLNVKIQELASIKTPNLAQARELMALNGELKGRVAELSAMKEAELSQAAQIEAAKGNTDADRRVQRLRDLLSQRDELEGRLKDHSTRLAEIKALKPEGLDDHAADDEAQMQQVERQNAVIEDEIANLRENVALLEYRVTTLQRYNGRNDPAVKAR